MSVWGQCFETQTLIGLQLEASGTLEDSVKSQVALLLTMSRVFVLGGPSEWVQIILMAHTNFLAISSGNDLPTVFTIVWFVYIFLAVVCFGAFYLSFGLFLLACVDLISPVSSASD